jgi:tetratricopeptide (TPR) repeat protein
MVRLGQGQFEDAIKDLTQAIGRDGRLVHAYANRGFCYLALGKTSEAEADFAKAIEMDPSMEAEITAARSKLFP